MIDDLTLLPDVTQAPEVPQNDAENQPEATEEPLVVQQQVAQKESNEAKNFRALREKSERIQRERDEAFMRLKQYEDAQKVESDALNLGPDDLAEGKHLSKVQKQIKALEQQVLEARLRAQYPDIDKVVSKENLELLQERSPSLARTIGASHDFYDKAIAAYDAIKQNGIYQDSAPYEADKNLVQRNAAKPRPLASVSPQQGDTPLSKANAFANGLTPELQKQLLKEMSDAMKSR